MSSQRPVERLLSSDGAVATRVRRSAAARRGYEFVAAARLRAERELLAGRHVERARAGRPTRARVLCYHAVGTPAWGVNDLTTALFEQHLQAAANLGYCFATLEEVLAASNAPLLAITFDDGLRSVRDNAAPVLRHHGVPWTMFVVTGWADGSHPTGSRHLLSWLELDRLSADGATIASHSVTHPNFGRLPVGEVERELVSSREALHAHLGIETAAFAVPLGGSSNWTSTAQRIAESVGYRTVYAQSEDRRPPGTVGRTFVSRYDRPAVFEAALRGAFDGWEEWLWAP